MNTQIENPRPRVLKPVHNARTRILFLGYEEAQRRKGTYLAPLTCLKNFSDGTLKSNLK